MKIYVIGIGPGNEELMTPQAKNALLESDVVVGYTVYVDLVKDLTAGKEILQTAMTQEVKRCEMALEKALQGKTVAFVCSGDAGVYAMAGIMREVAEDKPEVEIITIAGITAACSGAAVLGAPLVHDFAVISLSDLLTPWEDIERRVDFASKADFVLCIYNPKSIKRHDYIKKACDIVLQNQKEDTPCGYVKNIGRENEYYKICTLRELADDYDDIDMFTTVFIGNSKTKIINGKMVTPRGYRGV